MNPALAFLLAIVFGPVIALLVFVWLEERKVLRDPEVQRRIEEAKAERRRKEKWEARKK